MRHVDPCVQNSVGGREGRDMQAGRKSSVLLLMDTLWVYGRICVCVRESSGDLDFLRLEAAAAAAAAAERKQRRRRRRRRRRKV